MSTAERGGLTSTGRCDDCPFGTSPVVHPELDPADILIIGESPGYDEIRTGKPFTGPSGKLLWGTLEQFDVSREQCAVTNSVCCSIPTSLPNKVSNPLVKQAVRGCRRRLVQEIDRVRPKLILALGNTALHALTEQFTTRITAERGRVRQVFVEELETHYDVLPTLHPAAILRTPGDFKKLRTDLEYATRLVRMGNDGAKDPGQTKWRVVRSEELAKVCDLLASSKLLGADIESSGVHPRDCWIVCLGVSWTKNKTVIFPEEFFYTKDENGKRQPNIHPRLRQLLEDPSITWVWQNGKFDTSFFQEQFGIEARTDEDTMLIHYSLDEQRGTHDLTQLASDYLGAEDYTKSVKKYATKGKHGWGSIPPSVLYPYLARDADYTLQLYFLLKQEQRKYPSLISVYEDILLPSSGFLQRVEQRGIHVDLDYISSLADHLYDQQSAILERLGELTDTIWDAGQYMADTDAKTAPAEFNPASPKQLSWVLFNRLGLRVPRGYDQNTSEATLGALPKHPVVKEIMTLRKINKRLGTYVEGMLREVEPDGRIHTTYLIHGTQTGRLSSRKPNMQNIPRNVEGEEFPIKSIFRASPGMMFVEADLDQAELRMLAHLSQDPVMLEIFLSGRKLHHEVAVMLYGEKYTKYQYIRAKAVNFGIPYGRTEYSLMAEHDMTYAEANKLIQDWFSRFPRVEEYLEEQRQRPFQGKPLVSPFGRRRRYPLITDQAKNEIRNESYNFAIQSGASDVTLIAAMLAEPLLRDMYAYIVNLVHDSILVECPDDMNHALTVKQIIADAVFTVGDKRLGSIVPFTTSAEYGYSWGHLKEFTE